MTIRNEVIMAAKYFLNPISPEGGTLFPLARGLYFLPSGKLSYSRSAQHLY